MQTPLPDNESSPTCFGFCRDCEDTHSLPSEKAIPYAQQLMGDLLTHRCLDFDQPVASQVAELSTDWLYSNMRGKMFGVLVCEDDDRKEVVLKAFSSKYNNHRSIPGWVPPLVNEQLFDATIEAGNQFIHPLTDRIAQIQKSAPEYKQLIEERKAVSHRILGELLALYEVHNFRNEQRTLRHAFDPEKNLPIGAGDCCAPKLLNHAAKNGLKPIALAEFFWGKETASGDRKEGEFYACCAERCEPLLGYMLCGVN